VDLAVDGLEEADGAVEHQAAVGGDRELGVAHVAALPRHQRR